MTNRGSDVIIFSKDRPWQLGQLLSSINKYTDFNKIFVILKNQDPYSDNYKKIIKRFEPKVFFYQERSNFKDAFYEILDRCNETVSFIVDDVFFYSDFSSQNAVDFMKRNSVLSYQFKMNEKYELCQTAGKKQKKPRSLEKKDGHWIWMGGDGTWDWNYPFDLTGSIYIKEDMKLVFEEIKKLDIRNPNDLEIAGANIFEKNSIDKFGKILMACQDRRVCACIAINHVNPRGSEWSIDIESSLMHFNNVVFDNFDYDEKFFADYEQKSVHITKYALKPSVI